MAFMLKQQVHIDIHSMQNEEIISLITALNDEAKYRGIKMPSATVTVPDLTDIEKAYCESGRKIQAIKEVRARLGVGLRESKDMVDAYSAAWEKLGKPVGGVPKYQY